MLWRKPAREKDTIEKVSDEIRKRQNGSIQESVGRYLGKNDGYGRKPGGTKKPGIDSPENPIVTRSSYRLFIAVDLTKGAEFTCRLFSVTSILFWPVWNY